MPDLTVAALEEFLKQEHVASWMRQTAGALKEYVAVRGSAVVRPFDVIGNHADTPPGDVPTHQLWNILCESGTRYAAVSIAMTRATLIREICCTLFRGNRQRRVEGKVLLIKEYQLP